MPGCGLNPACWAEAGVGAAVGGAIEDLAQSISQALSEIVLTLATFWVDLPTSNLTSDGVNPTPTVAFLQDGLWYWTAALAVLAVIVGGSRMVWEQRGAPIRELIRSLLTLTLVSGMGLAVIAFLIVAADGFSSWIIDQATEGDGFANAIQAMLIAGEGDVAVFMVIILGLIGIITSVTQIVLMVVRSGMLVILAGILPTTAAFTNTEMGKQWFQKTIGWTIAFILYKPAAAIVYAVAFRLIDGGELSGATALLNSITGLALMVVALFALPALLRFVTPLVGAVASGGGGGMAAGAGAAAMAAMPSGAKSMGSAGRGGGSASPTPASSSGGGQGSGGGGGGSKSSPSGSSATGSSSGGASPTPGSSGGGKSASPSGGAPALAGAGSSGANKAAGGGGGTPAASSGAGPTGGAAASGGGAAAGGGASGAAAGAKAGAVAGPVGAAAGAAVSVASKGAEAVKKVSDEAAGDGPSGSNSK